MLSSAQMATDPQTKVAILVNIEPLVQRLFGVVQALEVVDQAQAVLAGSTDPDDVSRMNFLNWERGILEAIRDGDDEALVQRFSAIRGNDGYPMRVRVSDALLEASVHKSRGNAADSANAWCSSCRTATSFPPSSSPTSVWPNSARAPADAAATRRGSLAAVPRTVYPEPATCGLVQAMQERG